MESLCRVCVGVCGSMCDCPFRQAFPGIPCGSVLGSHPYILCASCSFRLIKARDAFLDSLSLSLSLSPATLSGDSLHFTVIKSLPCFATNLERRQIAKNVSVTRGGQKLFSSDSFQPSVEPVVVQCNQFVEVATILPLHGNEKAEKKIGEFFSPFVFTWLFFFFRWKDPGSHFRPPRRTVTFDAMAESSSSPTVSATKPTDEDLKALSGGQQLLKVRKKNKKKHANPK